MPNLTTILFAVIGVLTMALIGLLILLHMAHLDNDKITAQFQACGADNSQYKTTIDQYNKNIESLKDEEAKLAIAAQEAQDDAVKQSQIYEKRLAETQKVKPTKDICGSANKLFTPYVGKAK